MSETTLHCEVDARVLAKALKAVAPVARATAKFAPLRGVLLEAAGDVLALRASVKSTDVVLRVPARVEAEGRVLISPKPALGALRRRDGAVRIDEAGDQLLFAGAGLPLLDAAEYPQPPEVVGATTDVGETELRAALDFALSGAAGDESRPILAAVHFDRGTLVGCDNYRIHATDLTTAITAPSPIHREAARLLVRLLSPRGDGRVSVAFSDGYASFEFDGGRVLARLVDGSYPLWRKVVTPLPAATDTGIEAGALRAALERAMAVCRDTYYVLLTPTDDGVEVAADDRSAGSTYREVVPGHLPHLLAFNPRLLLDALPASGTLTLGSEKTLAPVLLRHSEGRTAVVMPVRTVETGTGWPVAA